MIKNVTKRIFKNVINEKAKSIYDYNIFESSSQSRP
jgi:hypothetical protein